MQPVLSNGAMRLADKITIEGGSPSELLMHRAGRAIAEEAASAAKRLSADSIIIVCGTGNNGGDGYVAAEILHKQNLPVAVYAAEGKLSADCERERRAYTGRYTSEIMGDIIVDCLFGTGLSRPLDGEFKNAVNAINSADAYVISADIPSGLNGDNGLISGVAVRANLTIAIAYPKAGLYLGDGKDCSGEIKVCDIGINCNTPTAYLAEAADIKKNFPARRHNSHKGTYGRACVTGGSEQYLGAAALSVSACLRSGCGYVFAVVPKNFRYALAAAYPQAIYTESPELSADAIAAGMGLGCTCETYNKVKNLLLNYSGKLIIDADGLNAVAKYGKQILKEAKCNVLITPHAGEMARLCGITVAEVLKDPIAVAQAFAAEYGVVVHLKGCSCVTTDGTTTVIIATGNSALAKAGSGDMLSGLICGVAARGIDLLNSAVCSQYLLGSAADVAAEAHSEYCATAAEILGAIPVALKKILTDF